MTMFDATIRVGELGLQAIPDENGKVYETYLVLGVIGVLPIGPGQTVPIPFGILRTPLQKKNIKDFIDQLQEAYNQMDDKSEIQTASSLAGVEKLAEFQKGLK